MALLFFLPLSIGKRVDAVFTALAKNMKSPYLIPQHHA